MAEAEPRPPPGAKVAKMGGWLLRELYGRGGGGGRGQDKAGTMHVLGDGEDRAATPEVGQERKLE